MPHAPHCALCGAPLPRVAAFCTACGRFVADDERALEIRAVGERSGRDPVVRVGAGEHTRRQLMVICAVSLPVLVLAVFVGHGRAKLPAPARTTSTSVVATTDLAVATTAPVANGAEVDVTPSDAPTATTIGQFSSLTDHPVTVFAATVSGAIVRFDLAEGTVRSYPQSHEQIDAVIAVQGGVFFRRGASVAFLSTGASPTETPLPVSPYLLGTPDGLGLLVANPDSPAQLAGGQLTYVGADLVAHRSSASIPLGPPVGFVTRDVLVQVNGLGVYGFDLSSGVAKKFLDGSYLASRGDEVAGIVCDDVLRCELDTTVNGRLHYHVPVPAGLGLNPADAALSPDGERLAFLGGGALRAFVDVVDLVTGRVTIMDANVNDPGPTLLWTPGGEFVVWTQSGIVMTWSGRQGDAVVALPFISAATDISVR